jgi:hypothetical protein
MINMVTVTKATKRARLTMVITVAMTKTVAMVTMVNEVTGYQGNSDNHG